MMIVNAVFHIYEYKKDNGCKLLDGRLLCDIKITGELISQGIIPRSSAA